MDEENDIMIKLQVILTIVWLNTFVSLWQESLDRHVCSVEMDVKESTKLKDGPNFTCTVCGAALATKHSLNTHLRTAHGMIAFLYLKPLYILLTVLFVVSNSFSALISCFRVSFHLFNSSLSVVVSSSYSFLTCFLSSFSPLSCSLLHLSIVLVALYLCLVTLSNFVLTLIFFSFLCLLLILLILFLFIFFCLSSSST